MAIRIHPTAEVSEKAVIGDGTSIWHHAQIREHAQVGRNCIIGKGVYVDAGVRIGDNVKIQNYVSVYRGVTIENGAFIGPHVCFTNDLRPRAVNPDGSLKTGEDWTLMETRIGWGASIGANSVIRCGVRIGEWAMIGAGSVVTHDIPPYGLAYGNPARLRGFVCSCGARLEKEAQDDDSVIARCSSCGRKIRIPISDWEATE